MQEIVLTDLIDVQVLQKIQNGFSKFTGMAALTTDAQGNPVTQGSGFTDFCMNLTRKTEKGFARCAECDRKGAVMTLEKGKPVVYDCHAGLVDFAAPIMVEGTIVGSFIGGQVRTVPIDEETMRQTAEDLGIDPEAYVAAAKKVNVIEYERAEQSAEFLSEIAAVLSQMAYSSYVALEQSKQLEKVARSHNNYIVDMNANMRQHVSEWIGVAEELKNAEGDVQEDILMKLMAKGEEFMSTIDDTVDFSKMANGEIELQEREYNIREMMHGIKHNVREELRDKGNHLSVNFSEQVPEILLGDAGRLNQIVTKLIRNANFYSPGGEIEVIIDAKKRSYATDLIIEVKDCGGGLTEDAYERIKNFLKDGISYSEGETQGIVVVPMLVERMSGTVDVDYVEGESTSFVVRLPQLEIHNK